MGTLANRNFVKMNGLGNEIVVVDLRAVAGRRSAPARRALQRGRRRAFDQLMALYPPRAAATDASVRIYNNDGSEAGACGNGMRCVASLRQCETGKTALTFETAAGVIDCRRTASGIVHRRHGRAAIALERDSAGGGVPRYARDRVADRPGRRAGPAFAVRRQHGQPARDLLGRRRRTPTIWRQIGPVLEHHPLFPERANISLAARRPRAITS